MRVLGQSGAIDTEIDRSRERERERDHPTVSHSGHAYRRLRDKTNPCYGRPSSPRGSEDEVARAECLSTRGTSRHPPVQSTSPGSGRASRKNYVKDDVVVQLVDMVDQWETSVMWWYSWWTWLTSGRPR